MILQIGAFELKHLMQILILWMSLTFSEHDSNENSSIQFRIFSCEK